MKCIVLLAMFVVAAHAYICPADMTAFTCFESSPGTPFCLTDLTWVCGNCGVLWAYCSAKADGHNPPTKTLDVMCAATPQPQC